MWRMTGPSSPEPTILDEPRRQRVVAVVEGLGHDEPRGGRRPGDRARLGRVGGEGLLAQHVLAGGQLARRDSATVQPVGQRVVDRVDVGVGHQRLVGGPGAGDLVAGGEGGRPLGVPGGHGHHLYALDPPGRGGEGWGVIRAAPSTPTRINTPPGLQGCPGAGEAVGARRRLPARPGQGRGAGRRSGG